MELLPIPRPRKRPLLLSLCAFLSSHVYVTPAAAFITSRSIGSTQFAVDVRHPSVGILYAARSNGKAKGNKPSSPKKEKNKSSSSPKSSSKNSPNKPPASAPKRRARTPPWQVLSSTEAIKNVETEIERRQLVKDGSIPSHQVTAARKDSGQKSQLSKSFLTPAQQQFCNWKRVSPFTTPLRLRFLGAHLDSQTLPPPLGVPEIAFLGRSNVGKSSLLNRLSSLSASDSSGSSSSNSGTNTFARVGQTPGATASVNFYTLTQTQKSRDWLGLVDLPGYGYAKLSRDRQQSIQQVAEHYLQRRGPELSLGILLVDVRRVPTTDDCAVLAALYDMGLPILVVATKRDKLKPNELTRQLETIREVLGLPDGQPLCVSSVTGEGCKDLWKIILEACEGAVSEFKSRYEGGADAVAQDDAVDSEEANAVFENSDDWYDDDEVAYSQGYDWIHGNTIMYEGDDDDFVEDEKEPDDGLDESEDDDDIAIQRETLKSLKKKARRMERRGEV